MVDTARFLTRQLQKASHDENVDVFSKKKTGTTSTTANVRSALGDLGNKIRNDNVQFMSKKDGMLALANKKKVEDDLQSLKCLGKEPTIDAIETKQKQPAIKHEFILLPDILNGKTTTTTAITKQVITTTTTTRCVQMLDAKPMETSKMDISEHHDGTEDIDIEANADSDEEVDEDMKSTLVVDIDENDFDNPQFLADYVKDIYVYLNQLERKFRISPNFLDNKTVTSKMRAVLIDWLIQVHLKFHLLQETLYLCVQIIDAYLQIEDVSKMQLQLVGVTAMFLASKYEEMYVPTIEDFVYMTDNTYTKAEIRRMEIKILQTLNFMFGKPIPLNFLRRFSKAGQADPKQHTLSKFLMELSLHDSEFASLDPSYLAACSLCLSYKLLDGPNWNDTLVFYSTYKYEQLLPGIKKLAKLVLRALESDYKYKAVVNKYGSSKFLRISLIPELHGTIMKQFANMDL